MIDVYLPVEPSVRRHIDDGSGIVGTPEGNRVTIDYEGNRYGYANVVTFADRVQVAAGRHAERYPTMARMSVEAESVVKVGTFDGARRIAIHLDHIDHVAAWIGCSVADLPLQLTVTR